MYFPTNDRRLSTEEAKHVPPVVGGVVGDGVVGAGVGPPNGQFAENRNKTHEPCQDVGY